MHPLAVRGRSLDSAASVGLKQGNIGKGGGGGSNHIYVQ